MSGVYIKNMEMPKNCRACPCYHQKQDDGYYDYEICGASGTVFNDGYSSVTGHKTHIDPFKQRLDNCPLVPVPPHGRLIDADALRAKQQENADLFQGSTAYGDKCRRDEAMNAVANIVNAPTIIPASFENPTKNARYSQDNPAEEGE